MIGSCRRIKTSLAKIDRGTATRTTEAKAQGRFTPTC